MSSVLKAETLEKKASTENGIRRLILTGISVGLEIAAIVAVMYQLKDYAEWIVIGSRILGAFLVLFIYNENKTSAMKMPWIILIMIFPFLGVSLYFFIGLSFSTRAGFISRFTPTRIMYFNSFVSFICRLSFIGDIC